MQQRVQPTAPKNTYCAVIMHRAKQRDSGMRRLSRMQVKEGFSCRCHLAKEQRALQVTCFSLTATKTPPHKRSTFKFLARDKLSPCVRVSKGV